MSRSDKLVARLMSEPKDFTWEELIRLLSFYGYREFKKGKTSGSRRKFVDANNNIISLHKPHPSTIMKLYAIREVIAHLKEKGHIKND